MSIKRVGFLVLILFASCIFALGCDDDGKAKCGNGKIEGDEQCDVSLGGNNCRDLGHDRGQIACNDDCTYDESACIDCGNGLAEEGEACDGTDLDGKTCEDLGHIGGYLACAENCNFDKSACHDWLPLNLVIVEYAAESEEGIPLEGATVALDAPSGERFEQVSRSDGRVTFENIDWSAGQTSITVHLDEYVMVSIVDFDTSAIEEEVPIYLSKIVPEVPETVTVTATATGLVDAASNMICVFPFRTYAEPNCGPGTDPVSFKVQANEPFTLVCTEGVDGGLPSGRGYFVDLDSIMILDHGPLAANASLDLDYIANAGTIETAAGRMVLPTRPDSPLRSGWPNLWVHDWNSSQPANTGWPSTIDISADGNAFDISYFWVEAPLIEAPYTYYQVVNTTTNEVSIVYKDGYPEPGVLDPPLLDVPRWIAPANPTMAHPISDTLEWELFDATDYTRLYVTRNGSAIWLVIEAQGSTSLTLPELPSSVVSDEFLGTAPLVGYLQVACVDEAYTRLERLVQAQMILLTP